jgi:hypothetical protein
MPVDTKEELYKKLNMLFQEFSDATGVMVTAIEIKWLTTGDYIMEKTSPHNVILSMEAKMR